jgi:electron transfer flavoprotein alpha subunit
MEPVLKRIVDFRCEDTLRKAIAAGAHYTTPVKAQLPHPPASESASAAGSCKVLVVAEVRDGRLHIGTAKAVSCGRRVGGKVEVALFAAHDPALTNVATKVEGVARVVEMGPVADPGQLGVKAAELIRARGYSHVFVPASPFGEQFMAHLSERLDVPVVRDVMRVVTANTFARPHGRSTIVTVEAVEHPVLATVRLGAFHAASLPRHRPVRRRPS